MKLTLIAAMFASSLAVAGASVAEDVQPTLSLHGVVETVDASAGTVRIAGHDLTGPFSIVSYLFPGLEVDALYVETAGQKRLTWVTEEETLFGS